MSFPLPTFDTCELDAATRSTPTFRRLLVIVSVLASDGSEDGGADPELIVAEVRRALPRLSGRGLLAICGERPYSEHSMKALYYEEWWYEYPAPCWMETLSYE
ncbi:hypothetical protein PM082_021351 [Marasmius tenuissimus]|nr:hypothetical protein PM082_021351 [Marasmius tenuissimus]